MKLNIIEKENSKERTSLLISETRKYLKNNPGSNILTVSPFIKISDIQDAVRGDDYFNSTITCIHPFDGSVRILENGEVRHTTVLEFFREPPNYSYSVFFDNPNLRNVEYIANKIRDLLNVDHFTITVKKGKIEWAKKALLPTYLDDSLLKYEYLYE